MWGVDLPRVANGDARTSLVAKIVTMVFVVKIVVLAVSHGRLMGMMERMDGLREAKGGREK